MDYVIPFVGVHVQKSIPTLGADGTLQSGNNGVIKLRQPRLPKGTQKLTVKHLGSKVVAPAQKTLTATSR